MRPRPARWPPARRVVARVLPRLGDQRERLVRGRRPDERAREPEHGGRGGRQVGGGAGRGAGSAGRVRGGPVQAVHVVAVHAAPGDGGGVPEHRRGGRRVAGERGGLLVPLLGLADQGAGEGEFRQVTREVVRVRAVFRLAGRPGEGRAEVVGDGVEPGPPVRAGDVEVGGPGQAPAKVPGPASASSPASASRSVPYWRIVSSARYSVAPADARTTSRLCSARRASPSATTTSSAPATSAAAVAVNGATNTDTRRSSSRSAGSSRGGSSRPPPAPNGAARRRGSRR